MKIKYQVKGINYEENELQNRSISMLTDQERQEILEETKLYPYPKAACLDALKIVQHHRRWVGDESIKDIAEILGMSAEEVDSVATFIAEFIVDL